MRALVLLSGGLDSMLATKILQEQGIKVVGITFVTPFFGSEKGKVAAKKLGISLIEKDITKKHLKIVENPPHGHGKNMNPCIDCHSLMLKEANKIAKKERFDFIATGEVLGERPFSQNRDALGIVEKESGTQEILLRPLSAKLLSETKIEKTGLVDRGKLLDIKGRGRRGQFSLAKKYSISDFPQPSGGCLLTDPGFSKRLKELFDKNPHFTERDIELLKIGRHSWIGREKIIVARNEEECEGLWKIAEDNETLLENKTKPGPITLIASSAPNPKTLKEAIRLAQKYSKHRDQITYGRKDQLRTKK